MKPKLSMYAREHRKITEIRDTRLYQARPLPSFESDWINDDSYWEIDDDGNDRLAKDGQELHLQLYCVMAWTQEELSMLSASNSYSPNLDHGCRMRAMYQPAQPHWIGALIYHVIRRDLLTHKVNPR